MKPIALVLSCEHAGNIVPDEYQTAFQDCNELTTHRGYDIGALDICQFLSQELQCELAQTSITRLLIDCNRSLNHPNCFSSFTHCLSQKEKQHIIDQYYLPYRQRVETQIQKYIGQKYQVLHLSIHSFTPILNGVVRNAAIGLLYDSKRHGEKEVARLWLGLLSNQTPAYRIRLNYPYQGKMDGFTQFLRKKYSEDNYLGLEVESNQALVEDADSFAELQYNLAISLKELLQLL